jgi:glyoxylase-like metal-dependent hydrolase (beta-lactamase superfamily II)
VNAGIIVGSEVTLIVDTGANAMAAATIHGYATAHAPVNRMMVINTEKHFDHIGGNSFFRDLGIDVYGHTELERTEAEFAEDRADFHISIPHPVRRTLHEEDAFYYGTRLANPNKSILDDAGFELGDCPVDILLTPGHTPTNISIFEPRDRVLFCGDCLTNLYTPNLDADTGAPAWKQWLRSLDRIERLAPQVILPGHGPAIVGEDVARVMDGVREVIVRAIAEGRSPTQV